MILDIDDLMMFMEKFIGTDKSEMGEQEGDTAPASDSGAATTSASPMKKWESGRTLGKTYMNDPKYKWETGITRGHGNPVP